MTPFSPWPQVEASPSARSDATSGLAGSGSNLARERAISQSFRVEELVEWR